MFLPLSSKSCWMTFDLCSMDAVNGFGQLMSVSNVHLVLVSLMYYSPHLSHVMSYTLGGGWGPVFRVNQHRCNGTWIGQTLVRPEFNWQGSHLHKTLTTHLLHPTASPLASRQISSDIWSSLPHIQMSSIIWPLNTFDLVHIYTSSYTPRHASHQAALCVKDSLQCCSSSALKCSPCFNTSV